MTTTLSVEPARIQMHDLTGVSRVSAPSNDEWQWTPEEPEPRRTFPGDQWKRRRVRQEHERSKAAVLKAVPPGHKLAKHVLRWRRAVLGCPGMTKLRKEARENTLALVHYLVARPSVDPKSMTVISVWDRACEALGIHRATLARTLRRLKDWGFLTTVAPGRLAMYTPKSTGRTQNEAAVYAFIRPAQIAATPVPLEELLNPPHAREEDSKNDQASPGQTSEPQRAARAAVNDLIANRKAPLWPAHETPNAMTKRGRREAERQAAGELQFRALVLRRISTAHVAAHCRAFFRAGWTISDILVALEELPDGSRRPHDAGVGIDNVGAWLRVVLAHWTDRSGAPLPSRDGRLAAERALTAARGRAREEKVADRPAPPAGGGWRTLYQQVHGKAWA